MPVELETVHVYNLIGAQTCPRPGAHVQEESANDSTYTFAAYTSSSYTTEFEAAVQHDLAFLKAAVGSVALYTFMVLCRWKSGLLGVRVTVTLAGAG